MMKTDWLEGLEQRVEEFFARASREEIDALLERANVAHYNRVRCNVFSHPIGFFQGMKDRLPIAASGPTPLRWARLAGERPFHPHDMQAAWAA